MKEQRSERKFYSAQFLQGLLVITALITVTACTGTVARTLRYDVRQYGARGDGVALDTKAVNATITAAVAAGGGTVYFPAGAYACHSIRLQSHITLYLDKGATIAAAPPSDVEGYDPPEPNRFDRYQDFGHSHFHNSLIWGEGLTDVAIVGPGMIDGSHGLVRGSTFDVDPAQIGSGMIGVPSNRVKGHPMGASPGYPDPNEQLAAGLGNKAIALKLCHNVTLRDISIRGGGHFALLATGDDSLTIDHVTADSNRDGLDIVSCHDVHVTHCTVNTPHDDAICLKSDFSLGYARACENVTIADCEVSGFDCPTLLDGRRLHGGGNGRIKLGTESNGGFRHITISKCVFESCLGLALETVDGGALEDVSIDNITLHRPSNSPIFLRLGGRLRGPPGTMVGKLTRVTISNVFADDADPQYASMIAGIPGHNVTGVKLSNIQVTSRGGGAEHSRSWATTQPAERVAAYPDPRMFGPTPAYGFFLRHAEGIEFENVKLRVTHEDLRPAFLLDDVTGVKFANIDAQQSQGVRPLTTHATKGIAISNFVGAGVSPADQP